MKSQLLNNVKIAISVFIIRGTDMPHESGVPSLLMLCLLAVSGMLLWAGSIVFYSTISIKSISLPPAPLVHLKQAPLN